MRNLSKSVLSGAASVVVITAAALGCSKHASDKPNDGAAIVKVDGSSTVYPINEAMAEGVGAKTSAPVKVTIGVSGTGGGLKKLCDGDVDIAAASRPIAVKELDECRAKNISFIELPIAFDGIAVVVHPKNAFAATMTVAELKKMWEPEAQGKVTKWSDVRAEWPKEELHLFGAGVDSGTFDYFTQAIVGKERSSRGDFTSSEDDNVLVQGIVGDRNALGFFGLAYAHANASKLKVVGIDAGNGAGPVVASPQTVLDGTYQPLARPLFIYVARPAADRPEVQRFVGAYLDNPKIIEEVGYVPLPDDVRTLARRRFESRTTGSIYDGHPKVGAKIAELLSATPPSAEGR